MLQVTGERGEAGRKASETGHEEEALAALVSLRITIRAVRIWL